MAAKNRNTKTINMRTLIMAITAIMLLGTGCQSKEKDMKTDNKEFNDIFKQGEEFKSDYFIGKVWLNRLVVKDDIFNSSIGNVTFEPGCRNNWHSHPGGQILLCTAGEGYYQEEGSPIRLLKEGDVVKIAPNVKHWHGATPDSWFAHISIETNPDAGAAVWLEPVTDEQYNNYQPQNK